MHSESLLSTLPMEAAPLPPTAPRPRTAASGVAARTRLFAGILRHSPWDALLISLAVAHGIVLLVFPFAPVIALGVWWNSNSIAHHFIHTPFFRRRTLNTLFSLYLSVLLGIPQTLWRDRHLAHHAGVARAVRLSPPLGIETILVLVLWGLLLVVAPRFFLMVYVPGYAAGLALCFLHGYYEHVRGTISHYGSVYNRLFFNDGYHVEHHASPGTHWKRLPRQVDPSATSSRWPAVLRWLDAFSLEGLERLVLRRPTLQRFVLNRHERAFRALLADLPPIEHVGIVGGGLFPRTALILQKLLPEAQLVVIDASEENIELAKENVNGRVEFIHGWYDPSQHNGFDLVVIPLSLIGDREAIYGQPPAPAVLVHDWLWRRRGQSRLVSIFLLKRLNLVRR